MTKAFTLVFTAAALLFGSAAVQAAPPRAKAYAKKKSVRVDRQRARALAEQAAVQYLPLKGTVSSWDEETEEWVPVTATEYTYDDHGRQASVVERDIEEEGGASRVSYTYDENGQVTVQLTEDSDDNGLTWYNAGRRVRVYDPIVTDFATENLIFYWEDQWVLSHGNKYPITRNDKDIITAVARQAPGDDDFEDIARLTNTVSTDGSAVTGSAISEMEYDGNGYKWSELVDLRNIVWHNTNGQVMAFEVEDYARGANRIASADSYYEGELDATLTGTYANDFEGTLSFEFLDGSSLVISREYTDEATGSYKEAYELSYWDLPEDEEDINGDGVFNDEDMVLYTEKEYYTVTLDEHGNVVKEESEAYYDDELDFLGGIINEYVYNSNGAMEQMTSYSYEFDEEERIPDIRVNLSEFFAFSGVDNVASESTTTLSATGRTLSVRSTGASTVTVTSLDGKTVATFKGEGAYTASLDNLASGIYIATASTGTDTVSAKIALR